MSATAEEELRVPPRAARGLASALTTSGLLLAGALAFQSVSPLADTPTGYQAFIDRSGEPMLLAKHDGAEPMTLTTATAGVQGTIYALTEETARALVRAVGDTGVDGAVQVERSYSTQVQPDGSILATTVLTVLNPDGYATAVTTGSGGITLIYSPPRMELPADATPGTTWSGEGRQTAIVESPIAVDIDSPFAFRGSINAAQPRDGRRCIDVDTVFEQTSPGARPYTRKTRSTWCDGLGPVDTINLSDGTRTQLVPPGSVRLGPVTPPEPEPLSVGNRLPGAFPNAEVLVQPAVMGGLIISATASAGDLRAVHATDNGQQVVWVQHPGGEIVGMTADDSLLYVATANRLLMAFDAAGRIHWLARLPDVAVGSPALTGDVVAVALLNGTTHAFDRSGGEELWSNRLADTVAVPPVASGDQIASADVSGLLTVTGADGTDGWSASIGGVRAPMTPLPDGGVLVLDAEQRLRAFDSAGVVRWTGKLDETIRGAGTVLDDIAVLPVEAGIIGIRLSDGTRAWRIDTPGRPTVDASGRIAAGGIAARVTPDGRLVDRVDLHAEDRWTLRHLWPLTMGKQRLVMDASGAVTVTGDA